MWILLLHLEMSMEAFEEGVSLLQQLRLNIFEIWQVHESVIYIQCLFEEPKTMEDDLESRGEMSCVHWLMMLTPGWLIQSVVMVNWVIADIFVSKLSSRMVKAMSP